MDDDFTPDFTTDFATNIGRFCPGASSPTWKMTL
jgi:hypothetical protein